MIQATSTAETWNKVTKMAQLNHNQLSHQILQVRTESIQWRRLRVLFSNLWWWTMWIKTKRIKTPTSIINSIRQAIYSPIIKEWWIITWSQIIRSGILMILDRAIMMQSFTIIRKAIMASYRGIQLKFSRSTTPEPSTQQCKWAACSKETCQSTPWTSEIAWISSTTCQCQVEFRTICWATWTKTIRYQWTSSKCSC